MDTFSWKQWPLGKINKIFSLAILILHQNKQKYNVVLKEEKKRFNIYEMFANSSTTETSLTLVLMGEGEGLILSSFFYELHLLKYPPLDNTKN